jgi:hypothetical protein
MDRTSLFKILGLPDSFGVVLLSFSLILLLSPYFSGADFGLFKIPTFGPPAKRWLRVIGPIIFGLVVLFFIPTIPTTGSRPGNHNNANATATTPTSTLAPSSSPTPSPTPTVTTPPKSTSTPTLASARRAAENLGSRWFIAFHNHDVESIARMSDPPFYIGGTLLLQGQDIRQEYEKRVFAPPGSDTAKVQLTNMKVKTIREAKAEGLKQADDPRLDTLHVNSDDFVIIFSINNSQHKLFLFTRKVGSEIKLAGFWISRIAFG